MKTPISLEDFPHIVQAHQQGRIRIPMRKDKSVIVRTVALSLAAILAPVVAGIAIWMVTASGSPTEQPQLRESPFALAATAEPAGRRLR